MIPNPLSAPPCLCLRFPLLLIAAIQSAAFAVDVPTLTLPQRLADALTSSQFARQIEPLSRDDREAAILKQITLGNIPDFLRSLKPITVEATDPQDTKHT